ncbi:hypothetical protein BKG91_03350 [Rodentibacter caecimuris]|uniref:hypothetical protein n=1 Tax=Rodentibacter caecimuris TaxID=1796644 RepID=UPI0007519DC7|nr:hypothetical protein [Rodentibacter heylii]AOF53720.1 Phage tail length tape-measure protein 1 [Pasteurellaceae bacterium NI1060]OOF75495.1 hypothetical protein BKG91_03350 [Rodentibacter heylii]
MSNNIGEISYTVSMELESLLTGGDKVNAVLDGMEKATGKAAKEFKKLDTEMTKTAQAVRLSGGHLNQIKNGLSDLARSAATGNVTVASFVKSISSLGFVLGPVAGMLISVGGLLLADFLSGLSESKNEANNLKNAMSELDKVIKISETGLVGLSNEYARLVKANGELAQHLKNAAINKFEYDVKNAKNAIKELVEEQKSWKKDAFSEGVRSVKEMGVALSNLGVEANSYSEAMMEATTGNARFSSAASTIKQTTEMLAENFGLSTDEAFKFGKMLAEVGENPTPERINDLVGYLNSLESNTDSGKEALHKFTQKLIDAGVNVSLVTEYLRELKGEMGGLATAAQNANFESLKKGLEQQKIALTKGAQAAKEYAIEHANLNQEQKNTLIAMSRENAELEEQNKKRKEAEAAAKKASREAESAAKKDLQTKQQVIDKLNQLNEQYKIVTIRQNEGELSAAKYTARLQLGAAATEEQKKQAEQLAEKIYNVTTAMSNFDSAMSKVKPTYQLDIDFARDTQSIDEGIAIYKAKIAEAEQEIAAIKAASGNNPLSVNSEQQLAELTAAKATYLANITEAEEARKLIEDEYREQRIAAEWEAWKRSSDGAAIFGNALDAMASNGGNAIAGLLSGTTSLRDAFRSIANTVLNSVISSLVEMGMAQVRQMVIGQAMAKATMAAQIAQAATITSAYAPAAAMVSLASYGANAAPAQAGMTATMATAQALAITGRKNGGVMSANQMYRVGENNQPEIYQARNGMQYMIPGNAGRMFSNKEVSKRNAGGGSSQTITINMTNHFESKDQSSDHSEWTSDLVDKIRGMIQYELREARRDGNAGAF